MNLKELLFKKELVLTSYRDNFIYQTAGTLCYLLALYFLVLEGYINGYLAGATIIFSRKLYVFKVTLDFIFSLFRKVPTKASIKPYDVIMALLGTWFTLCLEPVHPNEIIISNQLVTFLSSLMIVGVVIQILAVSSLNFSFSVIPANRGIKTVGLYRFVRHPLYFSYFISLTSYLLIHLSLYNVIIYALWMFFQIQRINNEERLLSESEEYQNYKNTVKWRLIPFVY